MYRKIALKRNRTKRVVISFCLGRIYAKATLKCVNRFHIHHNECCSWALTYRIIMPCLSKPSIQRIRFFLFPERPFHRRCRAPIFAFDMQSGFTFRFGKVCVALSSRIDYKLASIVIYSHCLSEGQGFWSSQYDALENGFFETLIPIFFFDTNVKRYLIFRTRLICANETQTLKRSEAREYL